MIVNMYSGLKKVCLLAGSLLTMQVSSEAQLVSGNVFLKGNYIEVGIAPNGALGSGVTAPAGYTYAGSLLGFIADPARDGWTTGSPAYFGDYFLPGTALESWGIRIGTTTYKGDRSVGPSSLSAGLTGSNTTYIDSPHVKKGVWEGTIGDLEVKQTISLGLNDMFFLFRIDLKNTGTDTIKDIYYMRYFDPDNEETITGNFATWNKIVHQLPNSRNRTLVEAVGNTHTDAYVALGSYDTRAKVWNSSTVFSASDDYAGIYNETLSGYNYDSSAAAIYVDRSIGIVFNVGNIAPGDSTLFYYTNVLAREFLDTAMIPLPLGFTSFDVSASACDVTLRWSFNEEELPQEVVIERSDNGKLFRPVAQVGNGLTSYTDRPSANGHAFYRIRAIDHEGKLVFTPTRMLSVNGCDTRKMFLTPNPAKQSVQIRSNTADADIVYQIESPDGKLIEKGILNKQTRSIPVEHIPNGNYFIRLTENRSTTELHKISIVH